MPLLRRSHDHRRNLRARRHTPRPTVARRRGQDRGTRRPSPPHRIAHPPEDPASGAASLPLRRLRPPVPGHRSCQNCPAKGRSGDKLPTAIIDPPTTPATVPAPTQAAAPANHHRRQTADQPPRVPSWGAFGRRPSLGRIAHDRPASETLHHKRPCRRAREPAELGGGS
jgi:hypothetical protein